MASLPTKIKLKILTPEIQAKMISDWRAVFGVH